MKRLLHLALAGSSSLLLAGPGCSCGGEPAPEGLDDLSTFIWDRFEPAEGLGAGAQETELRDAVVQLRAQFDELQIEADAPFTGTLDRISKERVETLEDIRGLDKIDLVQGFTISNVATCTQQQTINLMLSNKALEVHPGVYETYEKTFDNVDEANAFRARDEAADTVGWTTEYRIQPPPLGSAYNATLTGAARRVRDEADPAKDILLTRTYLTDVVFDGGGEFDFDAQLEVYFTRDDGTPAHFYAMWRRMKFGPVDSSNDVFIDQTLSGFVDWEKEADVACESGLADD
jgi:hypothetical protein